MSELVCESLHSTFAATSDVETESPKDAMTHLKPYILSVRRALADNSRSPSLHGVLNFLSWCGL